MLLCGPADRSLCSRTTAGCYTLGKALDYIFDHNTGEQRDQETDGEDCLETKESEADDSTEYNPDLEMPDEDKFSDEDNDHAEVAITFKSRNGNFSPPEN